MIANTCGSLLRAKVCTNALDAMLFGGLLNE
jgi:hypothetical protein